MRKTILALSAAVLLSGCGSSPTPAAPAPSSGEAFWPAYMDVLAGRTPPTDRCHPRTLPDMLIPCSQGGTP